MIRACGAENSGFAAMPRNIFSGFEMIKLCSRNMLPNFRILLVPKYIITIWIYTIVFIYIVRCVIF